jgi:hypothetical protein
MYIMYIFNLNMTAFIVIQMETYRCLSNKKRDLPDGLGKLPYVL